MAWSGNGTVLFQLESEDDYDYYWQDNDDNDENWYEDEGWCDDGSWLDPSLADAESQCYQQEKFA